jgi:hypothetical protein
MELKSKLLAKHRKVARSVELEFEGGKVTVDVVRPTVGDRIKLVQRAQDDGLLNAENKPATPLASLRFVARLAIALVRVDGRALFAPEDEDDVLEAPFFEALASCVQEVFTPDDEAVLGK